MLILLLLLPLIGALAIAAGLPERRTAFFTALASVLASAGCLLAYDRAQGGFQFASSFPVLSDWHISFALGADGLSLLMLLLTAVVTLCAVAVAPDHLTKPRAYFVSLLLISAGATGAFAATDMLFFYMFHELALIPTFLMIGIWGTGERFRAAWKITIYLAAGSFVLLIGLLGLYLLMPETARTLDMTRLVEVFAANPPAKEAARWVTLLLLAGFGILISLFPFHTWAPEAYASAPVPAAMLHAGVLKKFGLYGLLRLVVPLLPEGLQHWSGLLTVLLLGNILAVGLATIGQKRLDSLLGYSSVMHMGYAFLGIASMNAIGVSGTALLLVAHGLSIALLFALAGEIRQRTGTLEFADLGGLANGAPFLGLAFGMAAFAAIGLPGFANFAAELMIFFGAFKNADPFSGFRPLQIATILSLWGVVLSAVYMLRAYRAVFFGPARSRCTGVSDLPLATRWPFFLLIGGLLLVGFCPKLLLDLFSPAFSQLPTLR